MFETVKNSGDVSTRAIQVSLRAQIVVDFVNTVRGKMVILKKK